jgi:hypothetical protein
MGGPAMNRRNFLGLPIGGALAVLGITRASAALVPPYFMSCVVALGGLVPDIRERVLYGYKWTAVGTGFFFGHLATFDPDPAKRQYNVYLVTAKHVVEGWNEQQEILKIRGFTTSNLMLRVNPTISSSLAANFDLKQIIDEGSPGWTNNPNNKDVSVLAVNIDLLRTGFGVYFFSDDESSANIQKLKDLKVSAGDGTFVLGFPMGLIGEKRDAVIVREGIIARIEDMLYSNSESFLIDSFVFPGNSGGPVILKPEISSIVGTPNQQRAYLIGMVDAYQPYREYAISPQTQENRVTFEENSGLATILPVDYIIDAIVADAIVSDGLGRRK